MPFYKCTYVCQETFYESIFSSSSLNRPLDLYTTSAYFEIIWLAC